MFINIKIPAGKLLLIALKTKNALNACAEVDKTISELPPISKEMDGQRAVEAREEKLQTFALMKHKFLVETTNAITPLMAEAFTEIDEQTTPNGEEIENNKDFLLFQYGTITSPDQLSRLIEKNNSLIFALNAEKYAKAHGWGADFDVHTDEGAVRDFCDEVFRICRSALQFPGGYFATYVNDDEFIEKVASAYGVLDRYEAAVLGLFPEEPEPEPDPEPDPDPENPGGDSTEPSDGEE